VGSPWSPDRIGSVLVYGFLIRRVAVLGGTGQQAIALQDFPLHHQYPVAGGGPLSRRSPDALIGPAAIDVGLGIDQVS